MKIEIYGRKKCVFCDKAKELCESYGLDYKYHELGVDFNRDKMKLLFPDAKTYPQIKLDEKSIGGFSQFQTMIELS